MSEYFEHITEANERWDILAFKYYGDAKKVDIILKANKQLSNIYPLVFRKGIKLKIPVIKKELIDESLLPPWKKGLQDGQG